MKEGREGRKGKKKEEREERRVGGREKNPVDLGYPVWKIMGIELLITRILCPR
jgi:hypothetical protein